MQELEGGPGYVFSIYPAYKVNPQFEAQHGLEAWCRSKDRLEERQRQVAVFVSLPALGSEVHGE
jgi:hypothetical protein